MSVTDLVDPKVDDLYSYANERGYSVPEGITQKAALVEIIGLHERQEQLSTQGVLAEPDETGEEVEDLPDGSTRATRPITDLNDAGDWRNPFTGLYVWHGQLTDPTTKPAMRVLVEDDRKKRRDRDGLVYVPAQSGDLVELLREVA